MKDILAAAAAAGLAFSATPAFAQDTQAKSPEIVERNANGKASKVMIDGKVIDVCMSQEQDGCINPREAGLKWGDGPLRYFPR